MTDRPDELAEAPFLSLVADVTQPVASIKITPEVDDRDGHRKRVRDRFLKVGGDALEDYELL
ncbi:MAG: repair protein RadC, partial [Devosia sp.]|nr:repair protein RadC [Devosia sp.]